MKALLLKLHYFLVPKRTELGFMPYTWLSYLIIYFFNYFFRTPEAFEIISSVIGIILFLFIFFLAFRLDRKRVIYAIVIIYFIGAALAFVNPGASVFFVYAASFCSQLKNPRKAIFIIILICGLIALQSWIFYFSPYFYLSAIFFSALIGINNVYFTELGNKNKALALSQAEVKSLAVTAERERIGRDLHDLVGHTFSLITKKAELAYKLIDTQTEQAKQEIKDIENTSRLSLQQVRDAVSDYRKMNFYGEIIAARVLLRAADIELNDRVEELNLSDTLSETLGYILREAVTNCVRHSNASACTIEFEQINKNYQLIISDNGNLQSLSEGNGFEGIRNRVLKVNGIFDYAMINGLSLSIKVPVNG